MKNNQIKRLHIISTIAGGNFENDRYVWQQLENCTSYVCAVYCRSIIYTSLLYTAAIIFLYFYLEHFTPNDHISQIKPTTIHFSFLENS
jgi:hypothetical protein